jgi:hypothetical protein
MHFESQALHAVAAAAHTDAPRFDVYTGIHKALRAFMHDTLTQLGRVDAADPFALGPVLDQVDELLAELRHHVRNEDDFVHAAIEARRPGGAARTGGDHAEHLAEIALLEDEVRALRTARPEQRAPAALRLYRELAAFVGENLRHMQVEETANHAALWSLYTDAELAALHDRLMASLPPQEMAVVVRWMARALAPQELTALFVDARAKMPAEPFDALFGLACAELGPVRRDALRCAVGLASTAPVADHPLAG